MSSHRRGQACKPHAHDLHADSTAPRRASDPSLTSACLTPESLLSQQPPRRSHHGSQQAHEVSALTLGACGSRWLALHDPSPAGGAAFELKTRRLLWRPLAPCSSARPGVERTERRHRSVNIYRVQVVRLFCYPPVRARHDRPWSFHDTLATRYRHAHGFVQDQPEERG